ncbi:hypothetical protein ZWY2020_024515 [Hordeum vulgare]|nr:hypothetical protein ZWY2020_024515 [Hordeum vulgare]
MPATFGQPSKHPASSNDAFLTIPPGAALEAPQQEVHRTSEYTQGVLNRAFHALRKVAVAMADGEKEAKAARAACREAMEGASAATKRCEEVEARLKVLQDEHAREGGCLEEGSPRPGGSPRRGREKKDVELASFPNVDLRLRTGLRSLCGEGFDEPLATPEGGFAAFAAELAVALENAIVQVDKILDSECRDLFFAAATRVFTHLHLREPRFDLGSMILPVPTEVLHSTTEVVKGPVDALVKRFDRVCNAQDAMLSSIWHEGLVRDRSASRRVTRMDIVTSTCTEKKIYI